MIGSYRTVDINTFLSKRQASIYASNSSVDSYWKILMKVIFEAFKNLMIIQKLHKACSTTEYLWLSFENKMCEICHAGKIFALENLRLCSIKNWFSLGLNM